MLEPKGGQMENAIVVDADVQAVAEFMQARIAASRLVAVADGLAAMAPLLWGRDKAESIQMLRLEPPQITVCAERTPLSATASVPVLVRADDGSAAVGVVVGLGVFFCRVLL